jgi:threonyl-tRNA synthetase
MLIIGDNEVESGAVSVRRRREDGDLGSMQAEEFIKLAVEEIENKTIR